MKYISFFISLVIIIILASCSENSNSPSINIKQVIGIDTVYSFIPGDGQNVGQDSAYFPENIFGMPYHGATEDTPAKSPEHILSLGLDGEITIGFKDYIIVNKPGPDFIIFENVFINPVNDKYFAEPAIVSISSDGINFVAFDFDSLTLNGCAGITPTFGNPADYKNCGGDKFDIALLNIDSVTHIRIRDVSRMILENEEHPYYDAIISGFDLDAVIGLNYEKIK
ncbi:hypothetical protein ACFLSQ_07150 [Bacteroidota bacterium]